MKVKVLVTGAAGFFGPHIVGQLLSAGADVICLDVEPGYRAGRLRRFEGQIPFITADITQNGLLEAATGPFDRLVHLAAIASPSLCDQNPTRAFDLNVNGTHNVLKLALKRGAERVVLANSGHVYGISPKYLPTDERHPLWLQDVYTVSKILAEQLCQLFYDNHGLSYASLRTYNAYGPGQTWGYFVPDIIIKARTGHIGLRGKDVTKDFIYIHDVASAYVKAVFSEYVGAINIGSGQETPLGEVASFIAAKLGATISELPENGAPGPTRMLCDRTRALKVLSWQPTVSLTDGLTATIGWWNERPLAPQ